MSKAFNLLFFLFFFCGLQAQTGKISSTSLQTVLDSLIHLPMSEEVYLAYQDIAKKSRQINYPHGEALANVHMGDYFVELGQSASALECYQLVTKIGENLKDTSLIAKGFVSLGILYSETNELEKAIAHFTKGNRMAEQVGDEKLYYAGIGGLGIDIVSFMQSI